MKAYSRHSYAARCPFYQDFIRLCNCYSLLWHSWRGRLLKALHNSINSVTPLFRQNIPKATLCVVLPWSAKMMMLTQRWRPICLRPFMSWPTILSTPWMDWTSCRKSDETQIRINGVPDKMSACDSLASSFVPREEVWQGGDERVSVQRVVNRLNM